MAVRIEKPRVTLVKKINQVVMTGTAKLCIPQCPITVGLPTSMTLPSFTRHCEHHNRNRKLKRGHNYTQLESSMYDEYCAWCKGRLPKELTIITLPV